MDKDTRSEKLYAKLVKISAKADAYGNFPDDNDFIEFETCFDDLYYQSLEDNFYWAHCPFSAFKNTLSERSAKFFSKFPDAEMNTFINREIDELHSILLPEPFLSEDNLIGLTTLGVPDSELIDAKSKRKQVEEALRVTFLFAPTDPEDQYIPLNNFKNELLSNIEYSFSKKREFLKKMLTTQSAADETVVDEVDNANVEVLPYIPDSIKEMITVLHEIGVIDHFSTIHPFNSASGLGRFLATLMKEDRRTITSYLTTIFNPDTKGNNSPLTSKLIKKVHSKLISIGVDPKRFKTKHP